MSEALITASIVIAGFILLAIGTIGRRRIERQDREKGRRI